MVISWNNNKLENIVMRDSATKRLMHKNPNLRKDITLLILAQIKQLKNLSTKTKSIDVNEIVNHSNQSRNNNTTQD